MDAVSVVVLTYRPKPEKLWPTLNSILLQRNVQVQIVIADDGSADNCHAAIRDFFAAKGFEAYTLVGNPVNGGTVKNLLSALAHCRYDAVKVISPGDLLFDETVLSRWVACYRAQGGVFSFAKAVYYNREHGDYQTVAHKCQPLELDIYRNFSENRERIIRNYLINRDWCLGCAILGDRDTLQRYLRLLEDKVIYTEDTVYSLMLACGESGGAFTENAVLYEYGTGISTAGNAQWQAKVDADRKTANDMLLDVMTLEGRLRRDVEQIFRVHEGNAIKKKLINLLTPGRLGFKLREILAPKWADRTLQVEFLRQTEEKEG